jgi:hypothetical protein
MLQRTITLLGWNMEDEEEFAAPEENYYVNMDQVENAMMKIFEELHELTSQLLARFDAIVPKIPDAIVPKIPIIDESKALLEEYRKIVEYEKNITMDASMDADTKAIFLEALNHRREDVKRDVVAYNDGKKRKASEISGTSS